MHPTASLQGNYWLRKQGVWVGILYPLSLMLINIEKCYYYVTMWKARVEKKNNPGNELWKQEFMKLLKQNIHIPKGLWDSRLFVLLWEFCPSVLSPSQMCRMWWSSFSQAGTPFFWEPWVWHQAVQAVPAASQQDWQQQDLSNLHQFAPQWHKLRASVLSPMPLPLLLTLLLFAFNLLCTLQVWPWHNLQLPMLCRQKINRIYSLQQLPSMSHSPHDENPEQHFQASLHSTS